MQFLNVYASYLFVLLGVIILFYLFRKQDRQFIIPSTLLWKGLELNKKSVRMKPKLRPELLMFLQLLILTLLIIALMNPHQIFVTEDTEKAVFIIDRSASTQAVDVSPNRFTQIINQARNELEALSSQTQAALVSATNRGEVLEGFTTNHSSISEQLSMLEPTDSALNFKDTINLAREILSDGDGKLMLFTDGAFSYVPEDIQDIEVFQIGNYAANIGITALDVQKLRGRTEYQILIKIANFFDEEKTVPIALAKPDGTTLRRTITISQNTTETVVFPITAQTRIPIEITLEVEDNLEVDNQAHAIIGPNEQLNTLLLSTGNIFLERALISNPNIRLFSQSQLPPEEELNDYDLLIFDRISSPELKNGNAIYINTLPDDYQHLVHGQIPFESIIIQEDSTHPILEFLNVTDLKIREILSVTPPENSNSVIASTNDPLLLTYENKNFQWVFLAFDLMSSNLPLQVGFPIFLHNMVEWFYPDIFNLQYSHYDTSKKIEALPNNTSTGYYTYLDSRGSENLLAVNLLSSQESNLQPQLQSQEPLKTETEQEQVNLAALWPYLILFALLLLAIEWHIYHRSPTRHIN